MPLPSDMPSIHNGSAVQRVAVFLDYENVRKGAIDAFGDGSTAPHEGIVNPAELAEEICEKRKKESELVDVFVYRGRPSTQHQPVPASFYDKFAARWNSDERVSIRKRDLKYRFYADGTYVAQEKGIDVWLATDLITKATSGKYDVMVIFSCDTDLLPALEYAMYQTSVWVEVACWGGRRGGTPLYVDTRAKAPHCHFVKRKVFASVREDGLFD